MNIALPILLLALGGLTFWLLTESSLKWYFKAACISAFCIFTIIFWGTLNTFLGWAAKGDDVPEKVLIHWVIVKEPNKLLGYEGQIYVLLESAKKDDANFLLKFFGHSSGRKVEPRLYGLAYNRELHERIEGEILPRLRQGQPVVGKLTKGARRGDEGENKGKNKGSGSESQSQEWQFHELLPSDFHEKPDR